MTTTATITAIPDFPFINGMNANGAISGGTFETNATNGAHQIPLLYSAGQVTTLPTGSAGWGMTGSINDQGLIAGYLITDPNTIPSSANPSVMTVMAEAVIWQNGSYTTLIGYPGDASSSASDINRSGVIVGSSGPDAAAVSHALEWQSTSAVPTVLPALAGATGASAYAINDVGTVVGVSEASYDSAVVWLDGQVSKLSTVANETSSQAYGINHAGQIIGQIYLNHEQAQGVLWQNGTITLLTTPGSVGTEANGLNDLGQVAGDAWGSDNVQYAVVWQNNGQAVDLNTLLPANSGWHLDKADAIDDKGDIVGVGTYLGTQYGFILTLGGSVASDASSAQSAVASFATGDLANKLLLSDSAADVSATLDGLQSLALAGELGSITLTDSGVPALALSANQLTTDAATLAAITSTYTLTVTAGSTNETIAAPTGHAMTVVFSGNAADYTVTDTANGIAVSGDGAVYQLSGATALSFADHTEILAASPGSGTVTTGNVTELYSAAFSREPDTAGLTFYQNYLKANPGTSLLQFADWFLASPEYTAAHSYAQTSAGDQQFIIDSYQNLLHRTPTAAEIAYYQTNVMAAGGQSHAQMLVYFSASAEFLKDVQITATQPADAQHWLVLI